jgi:multisubunit Na+/H+ antiporter MnhE subunit
MRHVGFILGFSFAAIVCLGFSMAMAGDSVCMFDPTSAACHTAEAARAIHFRVYFIAAIIIAVLAVVLHFARSRLLGGALVALAVGPFLTLFLPL